MSPILLIATLPRCVICLLGEEIRKLTRMAGYVIANVVWKDSEGLAVYKRIMPPSVKKYGGRFLVRGGATEVLEGEWSPALVLIEFPTVEQARRSSRLRSRSRYVSKLQRSSMM